MSHAVHWDLPVLKIVHHDLAIWFGYDLALSGAVYDLTGLFGSHGYWNINKPVLFNWREEEVGCGST